MILDLLHEQQAKMEHEIKNMTLVKEKLSVLQDEFKNQGMPSISSDDDLNELLIKKERHQKTDIMTFLLIGCYIITLIFGFILATRIGGFYPFVMIGIAVILLFGLIYYHSSVNTYI